MKLSAIVKNLCDTINEQGPKKASWAVAALATLGSPEAPAAYDEKRAKQRARMGLGVEEKPAPKGTTHYSAVAHVAAYNRKGGQ